MDEFIDSTSVTTDQKFMFMLLDKIDNLEEQVITLRNRIFRPPIIVDNIAKDFYERLKKKYENISEQEFEEMTAKLKTIVPEHLFNKLNKKHYNSLLSSLQQDVNTQSFVSSFACTFLEDFKEIDEEFLNWYMEKLNITM
jgi:hypothetical protein